MSRAFTLTSTAPRRPSRQSLPTAKRRRVDLQLIRWSERHNPPPNGLPKGMVPTLNAGTFLRRSRVSRYVHSYHADGTVAATMQERPRDVFDRVFGSFAFSSDDTDARRRRLKRSVLDSIVISIDSTQVIRTCPAIKAAATNGRTSSMKRRRTSNCVFTLT